MKNILVPIDFSKQSLEAFDVGIAIAKKTQGKVIMVHVFFHPVIYDTGLAGQPIALNQAFADSIQEEILQKLDRIKNKSNSGVKVTSKVLFDDFTPSIKSAIEKHNADLVVIGSSGVSGLSGMFVGSVTEKIVRNSPVPVLTVWKSFQPRDVKNILLPSTLDLNQSGFMREVKKLQNFFNATLHILFVNTPLAFMTDKEVQESFEKFIRRYSITNYKTHFRNSRNETDGIMNFAYNQRMNLIAMATHARKGLSHFFFESVTEDIVSKATIPIWTYSLRKY